MTDGAAIRTDLFSCTESPCPDGAALNILRAADGTELRLASWHPGGRPRGTVLILQGRAEFIEKYFETVSDLLGRGFAVVAFDWRGQGGSGRHVADPAKGHVGDFGEYRRDLDAVAAHLEATRHPRPILAFAHSMGGAIGLEAAHGGTLPAEALAALAPMIDLSLVRRPKLVRAAIFVLDRLGLGTRYIPGGNGRSISTMPFAGNRLSGDPARYERNRRVAAAVGPVAIGAPTIGWLASAFRAMRDLQSDGRAAAIRLPVTLIGAGEDPICNTGAAEIFAGGLAGGGGAAIVPGARHELLMENDDIRRATWAVLDRFLDAHAPRVAAVSIGETPQDALVQATIPAGHD